MKVKIEIEVKDLAEMGQAKKSLEELAKNLTPRNLRVLAEKSRIQGINAKIQSYKHLL